MTTVICHLDDIYEIFFTLDGVESILRYRRCIDGKGELVNYDTLSPQIQIKIYNKLKSEIEYAKYHNQDDSA